VLEKQVSKTLVGTGKNFGRVLDAMKELEQNPGNPAKLAGLRDMAQAYLDHAFKDLKEADRNDKVNKVKIATAEQLLKKLRPLEAKAQVESGNVKQLGKDQDAGASESFFISDGSGKKLFIFKPSDGENEAGYGWEQGGGAPREAMLSTVNDLIRGSTGLECGVFPTTLVGLKGQGLESQNVKESTRVGSVQNFVSSKGDLEKLQMKEPNVLDSVSDENVQNILALDMMTLQLDRNMGNLLVQEDPPGTNRLVPIDAGNAMPGRKAFEANRRGFANTNALLTTPQAQKPFSPEMLQKIDALDPKQVAEGMRKTREEMAKLDSQVAGKISDETIEMTERSMMFFKKAAKQMSPAQLATAYAFEFVTVLDADPKKVDEAVDKAIAAALQRFAIQDQYQKLNGDQELQLLGYSDAQIIGLEDDPAARLDLVKKKVPNPAVVKEVQDIATLLGGTDKIDPKYDTLPWVGRVQRARGAKEQHEAKAIAADTKLVTQAKALNVDLNLPNEGMVAVVLLAVKDYEAWGGDVELQKRGQDPTKLSFKDKQKVQFAGQATDLAKKLTTKLGNNRWLKAALEDHKNNPPELLKQLRALEEYTDLGGDNKYVELGGANVNDPRLQPFALLRTLKDLLAVKG